ncbi:hypothetical protein ABIF21_000151 [Bradyrhizobium elkanii]|uniref:hypothetical protein n=1 Tax=Bradyrhizobium elkanii TaxID=29448 RepID=UPI00102067E2|nr:hypothetical protein [Bradyrhizobium elkanii]NWL43829.1 hypothetical protein [Bradyrhizobium elkanii]RYM19364.1 hypothetical protein EWH13_28815 [Bradyrhizobium elkanii]
MFISPQIVATRPPAIVSAGGFTPTTFDAASLSNVTLSNGNLTATRSNTSVGGAQSIAAKGTGKFYWEVLVGASHANTDFIGIASPTAGYFVCVNGNDGTGIWLGDGRTPNNGSPTGVLGAANAPGTVIRNAYDAGNKKFWQAVNGGLWEGSGTADPTTNTGGRTQTNATMQPLVAFATNGAPQIGDNYTANFGATAFAYAVPFGFTAGWPP